MFEFLKKKKPKKETTKSGWWIFNPWSSLEFAECKKCGYEEEPENPWDDYPEFCPGCGAMMIDNTIEDDEWT